VKKITKKDIETLKETNANMASNALRILAVAYKELKISHHSESSSG
jgi:magnesium-transporting ATPase (P-type)